MGKLDQYVPVSAQTFRQARALGQLNYAGFFLEPGIPPRNSERLLQWYRALQPYLPDIEPATELMGDFILLDDEGSCLYEPGAVRIPPNVDAVRWKQAARGLSTPMAATTRMMLLVPGSPQAPRMVLRGDRPTKEWARWIAVNYQWLANPNSGDALKLKRYLDAHPQRHRDDYSTTLIDSASQANLIKLLEELPDWEFRRSSRGDMSFTLEDGPVEWSLYGSLPSQIAPLTPGRSVYLARRDRLALSERRAPAPGIYLGTKYTTKEALITWIETSMAEAPPF